MHISKKLKALAIGFCILTASLCFVGCSQSADTKEKKIGIVQIVEHDALDAANKGFIAGLKERGFEEGKNIAIDRQNAQADQSNLQNIAQRFVNSKMTLVCAIATPAAQSMANATPDIPIVGTAITDYVGAKLAASNEKPGSNVTGTSDLSPVKEQIDLMLKICPTVKTIGIIYCSSEINSEVQAKIITEYAESRGLSVKQATISTVNDIQQAANSLIGSVDAFFEPTDNVMASAVPTLLAITNEANKPVFCSEDNWVKAGSLATYGIDYYKLGVQTGHMAADILEGKKKPADMPIEIAKELKVSINKKTAEQLGIKIPADILKDAQIFE